MVLKIFQPWFEDIKNSKKLPIVVKNGYKFIEFQVKFEQVELASRLTIGHEGYCGLGNKIFKNWGENSAVKNKNKIEIFLSFFNMYFLVIFRQKLILASLFNGDSPAWLTSIF